MNQILFVYGEVLTVERWGSILNLVDGWIPRLKQLMRNVNYVEDPPGG